MAGQLTIPNKILIVSRPISTYMDSEIPQAFVVNPDNKDQYTSAIKWATEVGHDDFSKTQFSLEPIEWLTDNKNFTVSMLSAAGQSSQGGKLSFWNCLVEKDGKQYVIGIEQENLLSTIKQSHMTYGTIDEHCMLAKNGATACIVHEQMKEWNESIKEEGIRKKAPKTIKWKAGHNYKSITTNNLFLGIVYDWADLTETIFKRQNRNGWHENVTKYHVKITDRPTIKLLTPSVHANWGITEFISKTRSTTVEELFRALNIEVLRSDTKKTLNDRVPILNTYFNSLLSKPVPREIGEIELQLSGNEDEALKELLDSIRNEYSQYIYKYNTALSVGQLMYGIGWTANDREPPRFTEEQKEGILNSISKYVDIDFGDGTVINGRA